MGDEPKDSDVFGGESCPRSGIVESVDAAKPNGSTTDGRAGSPGSKSFLLKYRRRKNGKVVADGMTWGDSRTHYAEKSAKNLYDRVNQKASHDDANTSRNCSLKHQRNIVLEQICQTLEIEYDLKKCIQDALSFHPGSGSRTAVKESVYSCEAGSKGIFHAASVHHGLEYALPNNMEMISCALANGSNHDTVTESCRRTLLSILMSEKFAHLCNLFLKHGMKAEKLFDLGHINLRMKEKAYESSPVLFHSDMQQVWTKLQKVGSEMVALAKYLSDKTLSSFHEQVGSCTNSIPDDGPHEFHMRKSDMHKAEVTGACALAEAYKCRHCGENTDGGNSLVCDSCEEMYHISCIEPAVKEIPSSSWYCAKCTASGIKSPHDNCLACERLNAFRSLFDGNEEVKLMYGVEPLQLGGSSNELVFNERDGRFPNCKVCRTEVRNDKDYRICGHSFCLHKFYHVQCLTSKQLIAHGPCWYCPSCLCRACFVDRDDDKIVLCDGCDHAWHIYCMEPPRTAIPKGKWFCTKCSAGIQRLCKAKSSYEKMQDKSKKRFLNGKVKIEEAVRKAGGVDMLLNAAKTLNYKENLTALGFKS